MKFLFFCLLVFSLPAASIEGAGSVELGISATPFPSQEEDEKLEVQEAIFVPWRTVNLTQVHKETLQEVLAEQTSSDEESSTENSVE